MTGVRVMRRWLPVVIAGALALAAWGGAAAVPADGAEGVSPWWGLTQGARPTVLEPNGSGQIVAWAENLGDGATSGNTTLTDVVPAALKVVGVAAIAGGAGELERGPMACKKEAAAGRQTTVTCTFGGEYVNAEHELVPEILPPYELLEVKISVQVSVEASSEESNAVTVSGGGAPRTISSSQHLNIGEGTSFGVEHYDLIPEDVGGGIDTQAGSHPFQLTSVIALNQAPLSRRGLPESKGLAKDIVGGLPVGMFGNPTPFAQCSDSQFATLVPQERSDGFFVNECAPQSAVGVAVVQFTEPGILGFKSTSVPIFNLTPLPGEPARFGFRAAGAVEVYLDTAVETGGSYAVSVGSYDITETASVLNVRLTFWGVPGDERHDKQRGWECLFDYGSCAPSTAGEPPPFLVMPTSCEQPFTSALHADSWGSSGHPSESVEARYTLPEGIDGCNHLSFEPSVSASPDVPDASTSTGLTVGVHVPQEAALNPEGLAASTLKDTTVALPAGVAINPSGGDGLEGCSEGLVGFTGVESGGLERDLFTPRLPGSHAAIEAGEEAPLAPGVNFCSNESKIAVATIHTPLLAHAIEGAIYVATQNANPFGSLLALYLVAEDPVSGTLVKLPGEVHLCQAAGEAADGMTCADAGQIVTTFKNTPELPFEELELHFFGGERAPLATPARCGPHTTQAAFVPWSGNETVQSDSTFNVTAGPYGGACPGATLPFSSTLAAGTIGIEAGAFSPLTTTIARGDGEQNMRSVTVHMPGGLSGLLSGVELCQEPQANAGLCGAGSQIGETTVEAGVGPHPVSVKGGKVFITGPYNGSGACTVGEAGCAPFGLSIVNPVKAGPFDLEHDTSNPNQTPACDCIVVRAKIEVDPVTAALTITTDPSGAHAIPELIDGVPVQIQKVNVLVNRPGFTFDPTNCEQLQITATIDGYEGASAGLAVPFKAHDCSNLKFEPKFGLSSGAKTSKASGAELSVKLAYPNVAPGTDANIKQVKVELPKGLPSRLKTLQQACLSAQFEASPAGCPAASKIGTAVVHTPLLPVPLEGSAIFVSHGGEEFPDLDIVLQGDGVKVILTGKTFISKAGVTSSTFKTVPDAPVSSFELKLPTGPYSALTTLAPGVSNLCAQTLVAPTEFVAQNGMKLDQSTHVEVEGCPVALYVISHGAKKNTASIVVKVPSAGKLTASGSGLGKTSVKATAAGQNVTVELALTKEERSFLSRHRGRRLEAAVRLRFTPAKGHALSATTTVVVG
jgi:hypothetical protein